MQIFTQLDGEDWKVGSIFTAAWTEAEYDSFTGERIVKIVQGWNWICKGAGKQRRGRGKFKSFDDAKKAFLKACGYAESSLKFID
jgi:hypothetical protein